MLLVRLNDQSFPQSEKICNVIKNYVILKITSTYNITEDHFHAQYFFMKLLIYLQFLLESQTV
jgi:hypothetical protein